MLAPDQLEVAVITFQWSIQSEFDKHINVIADLQSIITTTLIWKPARLLFKVLQLRDMNVRPEVGRVKQPRPPRS